MPEITITTEVGTRHRGEVIDTDKTTAKQLIERGDAVPGRQVLPAVSSEDSSAESSKPKEPRKRIEHETAMVKHI